MTGRRTPMLGATTRRFSAQAPEPIGYATSKTGANRAGAAIVSLAHRIGTLLVLADPDDTTGRVYVVPNVSERARVFAARRPEWIVGVFNRMAAASDIAEAILIARQHVDEKRI